MLNKISIALLAAASVVSLCMLPRTGTDAAKLLPAQVLVIAQEDGRITVESDNGASGSGTTLPDALAAMREGAEGTLFLDTAEHIILLQSTQSLLPAAVRQRQFRPAAKLYLARMDALDADGCGDACGRARSTSARRSTRPGDSAAGGKRRDHSCRIS